ncbi:MAG: alpha/beta hydrolase family protein [SAR86 cluster bacterium SAR86A]|jgi:pimeloyl-ACP methyl ester carboxylesterase|uniref:Alpha/beta hydrolase family protein n=1 Tax=SAR86 cluster bacterium SAR86A TaxID=1123866 RepID=J5KBZ7_9GAMM|nr:MAG: alpha/beta hydrolase family protein [SAR86 cluster bacterium SAR86A]|tara:strand:+ start:1330 stop:2220 length:891 start_codon:yes stop_codon:yes gene_type:complete
MTITDNLISDISNAPEWFLKSIANKGVDVLINDPNGDISYSKWKSNNQSKNLLILIHGTGAHKKWWDPIAPQFIDDTNVIAVDLPGMGDSDFREKYSIKDFGSCIFSIIEKEKKDAQIENIYIVGHSLGGQVAAYLASEYKDLVTSLIMIDTFIRPPDYDPSEHEGGPLRKIKYYPDKKTILQRFRLMPTQECKNDWFLRYIAEYSVREVEDGWRWKFDDLMFNSLERLFGYKFSFKCPALFIYGANSLLMSGNILSNIKKMYSDIMEFEKVDEAAHHVPLDKPLEIVDIIKKRLF